ncbi:MAG: hypothetical protein IJL33_00255 [Ruminococcus sp.]|nr:hypothetical protein [Ruminococcus sp.]
MTTEQQEAIVIPLSIYSDYARKLEDDADTLQANTWATCKRDFEDSVLDDLRIILRKTANEVRATLQGKIAALPPSISKEMLKAYGVE